MGDTSKKPNSGGLASVLAEYLTRIDRGDVICREAFLAEHSQHIAALQDYFADVDLIERFASGSPPAPSYRAAETPREFGEYDLLGEIGRDEAAIAALRAAKVI